ncbi:MAG: lysophospholipid acyltransferase family protein [Actinomycetaceae bacterium]|nr:lysophospholipid acyltransferase family protein [Actinomycetaceae bacterium]
MTKETNTERFLSEKKRRPPRYFSWVYRFSYHVARIPVALVTRPEWSGQEYLPKTGGFITISNHVTEADSLTFMHYMLEGGVPPRVLCKEELFRVPVLGWILRKCGQIPVKRDTKEAGGVLDVAARALAYGECVAMFPEGTLTRDPDYWPMKPKNGVARLALRTRVPVIPVAQWGAQDILDRYSRRPRVWPPKKVQVHALPPVDLADLYEHADKHWAWEEASRRMMAPIIARLEDIRGETARERMWDRKVDGDLGKKGLAQMEKQWALDEPGLPSLRRSKHPLKGQ